MKDRQPADPGRVKITLDDGTVLNGVLERNDSPQEEGTPINKATLFDDDNEARTGAETPSEGFDAILKDWGTFSVPLSGWSSSTSNGWYTNRVNIADMKAAYNPFADVVYSSGSTAEDRSAAFACIKEIETFDGYIICRAIEKPDITFSIRLMGV